jgi:hypothetical protein
MQNDSALLRRPIVVVSTGRAGSTIVTECLFAHRELAWPTNHLEWFPRQRWLSSLRRAFDNDWWHLTGEKAQHQATRPGNTLLPCPAEAFPFWETLVPARRRFSRSFLLGERATDGERQHIRNVFGDLVRRQGRSRLAFKLTGPGRLGYLRSLFPDAQFVHVVRGLEHTVESFLHAPFWQANGAHRLWWTGAWSSRELCKYEALRHDPRAGTRFQIEKLVATTREEARDTGTELVTVAYEAFLAAPEAVLDDLRRRLDLPPCDRLALKLAATRIARPATAPATAS